MPRLLLVTLCLSAALAAGARAASAGTTEGSEAAPRARRSAAYAVMGAGTPVGFVGLEGVHRFGSVVEVAVGFGRGFAASGLQGASFGHDLQWSVMPRLRYGDDHHAMTFGAGVSGGNYGNVELFCDSPCTSGNRPSNYVLWANFEVGGEHWWNGGFALRYFVGYAQGCSATSCTEAAGGGGLGIPYFGIGFGYAF